MLLRAQIACWAPEGVGQNDFDSRTSIRHSMQTGTRRAEEQAEVGALEVQTSNAELNLTAKITLQLQLTCPCPSPLVIE
jgi:hypothetical protein